MKFSTQKGMLMLAGGVLGLGLGLGSADVHATEMTGQSDLKSGIKHITKKGSRLPYTVLRSDMLDGLDPEVTMEVRNGCYDSFNRRTSKVVNDVTITFFYDQDRCVIEYNGAGAVERKFIYGPGPFSQILMNRLSWKPAAKSTTITTTPSAR